MGLFPNVFDEAPRALARVIEIGPDGSATVEFEDERGRASVGIAAAVASGLKAGDAVEIAYVPYSDEVIEEADPLMLQMRAWLDRAGDPMGARQVSSSGQGRGAGGVRHYNVSLLDGAGRPLKRTKWS